MFKTKTIFFIKYLRLKTLNKVYLGRGSHKYFKWKITLWFFIRVTYYREKSLEKTFQLTKKTFFFSLFSTLLRSTKNHFSNFQVKLFVTPFLYFTKKLLLCYTTLSSELICSVQFLSTNLIFMLFLIC